MFPRPPRNSLPKGWYDMRGRRWREGREGKGVEKRKRRPSGAFPAALLEPLWCSSGTFLGAFISPFGDLFWCSPVARERALHHDREKRWGRLTTCESSHSCVWSSLSFLSRVDSVRAHLTKKNHILAEKIPKMNIDLLLRPPFLPHTSRRLR